MLQKTASQRGAAHIMKPVVSISMSPESFSSGVSCRSPGLAAGADETGADCGSLDNCSGFLGCNAVTACAELSHKAPQARSAKIHVFPQFLEHQSMSMAD